MTEERTRVLRMLASGAITVEQANQLLEKLGEHSEPRGEAGATEHLEAAADAATEAYEPMFGEFTFDQALQLGVVGIEPSFIADVRAAGLTDLSFDQIVHLGAVGVDPAFVVAARQSGVELSFDQIVQLGVVGVDPSFITRVRDAGLTDLSFDQIVQLGAVGVEPEVLVKFRTPGTRRREQTVGS